jgi:hypothetical protein
VIVAEGFRDDPDEPRGVWLSPLLDCWGERGRTLLEVTLDLSEDEIRPFVVEAAADEVWDDEAGDFIKANEIDVERFTWYAIPADVVNARGRVRLIGEDERRRLALGWWPEPCPVPCRDPLTPPAGRVDSLRR